MFLGCSLHAYPWARYTENSIKMDQFFSHIELMLCFGGGEERQMNKEIRLQIVMGSVKELCQSKERHT